VCSEASPEQCYHLQCRNGGLCVAVLDSVVCRCTENWAGTDCSEPLANTQNPCRNFCHHAGVCVLESPLSVPICRCLEGWTGPRCQNKATCRNFCFNGATCQEPANSDAKPVCICPKDFEGVRCETHLPNYSHTTDGEKEEGSSALLVVLLIGFLVLLAVATGGVIFVLYRRRLGGGKSFAHVRMQDNVEITNPIYLREDDADDPLEHSFTLDSDKVRILLSYQKSALIFEPVFSIKDSFGRVLKSCYQFQGLFATVWRPYIRNSHQNFKNCRNIRNNLKKTFS